MSIISVSSSSPFLVGLGIISALFISACSTGTGQFCDGKTSALCASGGAGTLGGSGSTDVGGATSTGGVTSTSTTVLKIEGNTIRDLSKPNISGSKPNNDPSTDSGADAGSEDEGTPVVLHGVNRSGTEYQCVKGYGIFDGPDTEVSVQAIASWKVNAVRVPLNESCWLNVNANGDSGPKVLPQFAGNNYKAAIQHYVSLLHKYNIYPILELHWVGYGTTLATGQLPMPDADHALDFWTDVTTTFKDDLGVVFELFNEPYPNSDGDNDTAWQCWKNGCTTTIVQWVQVDGGWTPETLGSYQATGFQQLVNAVRTAEGNTAASHVILLGGVQYSNRLTQWAKYRPTDPANNIGAAWHIYNNNGCKDTTCFDGVPATLAATTAIVATEIGENDCQGSIITNWMNWFDSYNIGYLAWSWDAYGACSATTSSSNGNPWSLITDYTSGNPNSTFAQTFHDHIATLVQ